MNMNGQKFRMSAIAGAGLLYLSLLGYSVFGTGGQTTEARVEGEQVRAPRVVHHDQGVNVYQRRSARSVDRRGGGLQGGK